MPNFKAQSSNQTSRPNGKVYDLEERTARFGENIISFAKTIARDEVTRPLISQVVRAGTSIGANYMEADGAESKKDFLHKISICKKEAKETKHWLRMIAKADENKNGDCKKTLAGGKGTESYLLCNCDISKTNKELNDLLALAV